MKLIAVALLLIAGVGVSSAIKCYVCSYSSGGGAGSNATCADGQFSDKAPSLNCGAGYDTCTAVSSNIDVLGIKQTSVSRSCTTAAACTPIDLFGQKTTCCKTDLCNKGTTANSSSTIARVSVGALVVAVARLFI